MKNLYEVMKPYHKAQKCAIDKIEKMKHDFIYNDSDSSDEESLYPKIKTNNLYGSMNGKEIK